MHSSTSPRSNHRLEVDGDLEVDKQSQQLANIYLPQMAGQK
jgi:hypothetical protein